ncbi:MAG: nitrite/sulfite reductase [Candidatus Dormibacteria bacterium]
MSVVARPPRPPRPEGQWALGYTEPLNKNERMKKDNDGLEVRDRILNIYSRRGFDSIDPADLGGRFRWMGLYTQLPEEGGRFMMRVRVPGGRLSADQVDAIAEVARRYGEDVLDVTDRQNFQFHNLRIEDVPATWELLDSVGLTTLETCGDVTRNILGCPTAGVDAEEFLDATELVLQVGRRLVGTREFSNLPRKYKISISGCLHQCAAHEINDVGLVGNRVDGEVGFDVYVGGGLATTPHFAQRLGVFALPEEVEEICWGITSLFRDYGYRRQRQRARLKFLVADRGVDWVRATLEEKYLKRQLRDGPAAPPSSAAHRDHIGVHRQKDGALYVGFPLVAGRTNAAQMTAISALSRKYGKGRMAATTQQKFLILDVPEPRVPALMDELAGLGLDVRPSTFRRSTMACTGIEFCKLALTETKSRAAEMVDELERRLPDFQDYARINLNGCPNSCARFQVADIGFMGSVVVLSGEPVEVYQVFLGGHLGEQSRLGRKVNRVRIRAERLTDFVENLLRSYLDRRLGGQDFTHWLNSLEDQDLQQVALAAVPAGALVEPGISEGGDILRAAPVLPGEVGRKRGQR